MGCVNITQQQSSISFLGQSQILSQCSTKLTGKDSPESYQSNSFKDFDSLVLDEDDKDDKYLYQYDTGLKRVIQVPKLLSVQKSTILTRRSFIN